MGENSFRYFLDSYLDIWRNSSLADMKRIISKDYKAREISAGEVVDFGYEQSIAGWEQGFNFVTLKDCCVFFINFLGEDELIYLPNLSI